MSEEPPRGLEEQRVFAAVARAMLGEDADRPTVGRYELRERLGSGAMGEVFSAFDPERERQLAIKVLAPDRESDTGATARIKREARALTKLAHDHIVRVFDVGEDGGRVYIAMEHLRGETLDDRLAREGAVPVDETLRLIGQVCAAVGHAHEHGIVHRDLKPANIFLCEGKDGPVAKVLDFGVAKGLSSATLGGSTASGTVLGTPYYMSPEQARDSSKVDGRADLWAIAIIAYECVLGARPFDATNLPDLAVQILTQAPPVPSHHGSVPPGFDAWFARATDADPAARPSSASELADSLAKTLATGSLNGARPASSRRWLWLAAGMLAVGAAGWVLASPGQTPTPSAVSEETKAPPRRAGAPDASPPAGHATATPPSDPPAPARPAAHDPSAPAPAAPPRVPSSPPPSTSAASKPAVSKPTPTRRTKSKSTRPNAPAGPVDDLEF